MDKIQSQTFDVVKLCAIVLVLYIHCNGEAIVLNKDFPKWTFSIVDFFSNKITAIAVPSFFLISGYLFYMKEEAFKQKVIKRVKSLFVPYIIWNSIAIIIYGLFFIKNDGALRFLSFIKDGGVNLYWSAYNFEDIHSNVFGWAIQNNGPLDFALWYVRNLMVLVLISPLLKLLIVKFKIFSLFIFAIIYFLEFFDFFSGISSLSLFFYSIGIWLAVYNENFCKQISFKKCLLFATIFLLLWYVFSSWVFFRLLFIIFGVALLFAFCNFISKKYPMLKINMNVIIFIYFSHTILLNQVVETIVNKLVQNNLVTSMIAYFMVPILLWGILYVCYICMYCFIPDFLYIILGRNKPIIKT